MNRTDTAVQWHDPASPPFQVAGLAWFEEERLYRRLPDRKSVV